MKKILSVLFSALMIITAMSFQPTQARSKTKHIVLVLKNPLNQESFSVFNITEQEGVLIGSNDQLDYPIQEGIYRIEAASNDQFYHKKIIIQ